MPQSEQEALNKQIAEWEEEIRRLAGMVAFASGGGCAFVKIVALDDDYKDVHPDLIMEDAIRVQPHGWPQGFSFEVLNRNE